MPLNESVKMEQPCEIINVVPFNPLISKCQIKVCYVGEEPNRNRSVITKETATKMANSLPGSPIVGYYNEKTGDFESHEKDLLFKDGKIVLQDACQPYGFVDLNAKVWFQFFEEQGVLREYLVTEGWLWTGQYPECRRIIEKGNNQSMELDDEIIDAYWTKDNKGNPEFFIINDAIFSKLCVLGEEVEPCFEGSQIKSTFSLEPDFKNKLQFMVQQLQDILKEGGISMDQEEKIEVAQEEETVVVTETETVEQPQTEGVEAQESTSTEFATNEKEEDEDKEEKKCEKCGKPLSECKCEDKDEEKKDKKEKYSLNEIPEYMELKNNYAALEASKNELQASYDALKAERDNLFAFKQSADKKEKEAMIKKFYMLSDEDKADVIENIDTYSLDDIEAKLSIICVRNRVSFDLEEKEEKSNDGLTYSFNGDIQDDNVPAWVKSVRSVAQSMN